MTVDSGALAERFGELFGRMPTLVAKAPGRVNIIGEHTDYSEGFVMPCAIDRGVAVAFAPEPDGKIVVYSEYADETAHGGAWPTPVGWVRIDLADPGAALDALPVGHWGRYVAGVAASLVEERLPVGGFSGVIESDLPVGAGLSSSTAVELAVAVALVASGQSNAAAIAGALADPSFRRSLALACQRAEHQAVGVKCGIMDQMAVALGRAGHALFLDCRTLDYEHVPLPPDTCLVVYNTGVSRHLAGSEYNVRRAQVEEAASRLAAFLAPEGGVRAIRTLRDVTAADLARAATADALSPVLLRRARHVVDENERTRRAAAALKECAATAATTAGALMWESHESLRSLFEVSCRELDEAVSAAARIAGVLGSRMTGAGFGGCTVSLVYNEHTKPLLDALHALAHPGSTCYIVRAANGVTLEVM